MITKILEFFGNLFNRDRADFSIITEKWESFASKTEESLEKSMEREEKLLNRIDQLEGKISELEKDLKECKKEHNEANAKITSLVKRMEAIENNKK